MATALWTGFRNQITTFINTHGSSVTITPRTPTAGSYGGYEPASDNAGTAVTTKATSNDYIFRKSGQNFGKLKEGELSLYLKHDETVDKDYVITWQSDDYSVQEIQKIMANDVVVARMV